MSERISIFSLRVSLQKPYSKKGKTVETPLKAKKHAKLISQDRFECRDGKMKGGILLERNNKNMSFRFTIGVAL